MNSLILDDEGAVNVFEKLSNERVLFIDGEIDDNVSAEICASLISKDLENNKQISIFINSGGGYIQNILTIYDTMKMIKSPIRTIAMGEVAYEAVLILAAGSKGNRFITKNSTVELSKLFHEYAQYSDVTDAKIHLEFLKIKNEAYVNSLSVCLSKKPKDILKLLDSKKYLNAQEAINLGIVDSLVKTKGDSLESR